MSERLTEWTDENGKTYIHEEGLVAELLDNDVVYVSGCDTKVTLFVGFNDVFYWATSDGEDFLTSEIETVWRAWKADPKWGIVKWAAKKRNMRPQWPMAKDIIADGAWDDEMQALPERDDNGDHGWTAERNVAAKARNKAL